MSALLGEDFIVNTSRPLLKLELLPPDDWGALLADWEGLLESAVESTVFLSPCWILTWWRCFGQEKEPCLLAAWNDSGRLCGLAAMYLERMRLPGRPSVVHFMGDEGVGSEYLCPLILPGYERAFLCGLFERLKRHWALADFRGLREDSPVASAMVDIMAAVPPQRVYRECQPCSMIPLTSDYETYLASLAAKFRTNIRYRMNKLMKNSRVTLVRTTREEEIEPHLERCFDMHQARWVAEGHPGSFYNLQKRNFYRDITRSFLQQQRLRFYHLEVDGIIRASQFGFIFNGILHSLQEAFDHRFHPPGVGGLGVVLRAMVIRECITEGLKGYDFLGGAEEFKTRWNTTTHYVHHVRIGAPSLKGSLAFSSTVSVLKVRRWGKRHAPQWLLNTRGKWHAWNRSRRLRQMGLSAGELLR